MKNFQIKIILAIIFLALAVGLLGAGVCFFVDKARAAGMEFIADSSHTVFSNLKGGDIVNIDSDNPPSGLLFMNCVGTAENPIFVRVDPADAELGKAAVLDGVYEGGQLWTINFSGSRWITIDGSAVSGKDRGIILDGKEILIQGLHSLDPDPSGLVFKNLEAKNYKVGALIQPPSGNAAIMGPEFRDCSFTNIKNEALYIGKSKWQAYAMTPKISNCVFDQIGWEAVQITHGYGAGGTLIDGNTFNNIGYRGDPDGEGGYTGAGIIISLGTNAAITKNVFSGMAKFAVYAQTSPDLTPVFTTALIQNNVVHSSDPQGAGQALFHIADGVSAFDVSFNTIDAAGRNYGIYSGDADVTASQNIIAGYDVDAVFSRAGKAENNSIGPILSMNFVDGSNHDYQLTVDTPKPPKDAALVYPLTDYLGTSRPQNGLADRGAYEYTGGVSDITPPSVPAGFSVR